MANAPSDEQLLAAFVRGDSAMFAELVRRYEQPLHAFICRLSGRPGDAPDVFQETFVRAFQHAASFRGESSVKTWLYAIAANVCRSRHRAAAAGARPSPPGRGEGEGAEDGAPLHPGGPHPTLSRRERGEAREGARGEASDPAAGPDGAAEAAELGHRIAAAVGVLPAEQREVFVLKAYEELSYPQIAEALGRPLGTVKSQMRLALGKLRTDLHQIAQDYGLA
jgi:RNA polymerase sigma-70 factor (ECF subfamily)